MYVGPRTYKDNEVQLCMWRTGNIKSWTTTHTIMFKRATGASKYTKILLDMFSLIYTHETPRTPNGYFNV